MNPEKIVFCTLPCFFWATGNEQNKISIWLCSPLLVFLIYISRYFWNSSMVDLINSFSFRFPASKRPPLENLDSFTHESLPWRSNLHMEAQLRVGGLERSYNDQLWNADHRSIFISASKKILTCIVVSATASLRNTIVLELLTHPQHFPCPKGFSQVQQAKAAWSIHAKLLWATKISVCFLALSSNCRWRQIL